MAPKACLRRWSTFTSYYWPGNIRELENLIERLTILTPHETIMLRDLPAGMRSTDQTATLKGCTEWFEAVKRSCRRI